MPVTPVATYNPATPAGMVRLLIADTTVDTPIFGDNEIAAFLAMPGVNADVRLAAALALEVIASNTTQVMKLIKTLDLETNGPAMARDLRAHAKSLRDEVEADGTEWAIAEHADNPFSWRERIFKQALREQF